MPAFYLVVDDDDDLRDLLVDILQGPGISVHVAKDAIEALAAFEAFHFDVVVTDVHMPRLSGLELAQRLRARHAHLVIVVLSGRAEPSPQTWAACGADVFLAKPFSKEALLDAIAWASRKRVPFP